MPFMAYCVSAGVGPSEWGDDDKRAFLIEQGEDGLWEMVGTHYCSSIVFAESDMVRAYDHHRTDVDTFVWLGELKGPDMPAIFDRFPPRHRPDIPVFVPAVR